MGFGPLKGAVLGTNGFRWVNSCPFNSWHRINSLYLKNQKAYEAYIYIFIINRANRRIKQSFESSIEQSLVGIGMGVVWERQLVLKWVQAARKQRETQAETQRAAT